MITGKEKILKYLKDNDSPYWTLYHYGGSSNTFLSRIDDDPNISIDNSIERLSNQFELINAGRYRITAKKKYSDAKGFIDTAIELLPDNNNQNTSSSVQNNNSINGIPTIVNPAVPISIAGLNGEQHVFVSQQTITEQVTSALKEYEAKQELKRLKEKIEEQEKELREYRKGSLDQTLIRIYDRFEPVLDKMIPKNNFKPALIAGAQHKSDNMQDNKTPVPAITADEYSDKLTSLLQEWENLHGGEPLQVIAAIVEMAKNSPEKYQMAKSFM